MNMTNHKTKTLDYLLIVFALAEQYVGHLRLLTRNSYGSRFSAENYKSRIVAALVQSATA